MNDEHLIPRVLDCIVSFHLLCIMYCGYFNMCCNLWVCVGVSFVMCECVCVCVCVGGGL